jgi:chaperone modulatory protein CbpM
MNQKILTGIVLDETIELSLTELCQACASSAERIVDLVNEGVLEPNGMEPAQWRFSGTSLVRAHVAIRLQQDLEINLAGIALVLDLMEEIESMRDRLRRFENDPGA